MPSYKEQVAELYEAFKRGDIPAVVSALAPDVEWTEAEGFPYGGTYSSPNAVLEQVFMKMSNDWNGFAAVPETLVCEGDIVVALGEYSGTWKATGKSFRAPFVHVWTFSGDKVSRFHQHTDTAMVQRALA